MARSLAFLIAFLSVTAFPATAASPTTRPTTRPATQPATRQFSPTLRAARMVAAKDDLAALEAALDIFEVDNGRYPTAEEGLKALIEAPADAKNWHGPYVKKLPDDPWGHPYVYRYPGTHNKHGFDLSSLGEDGKEGTADDVTNWENNK